ncbi:MAG: outer membrane lipoprotein-sorting protein [Spirochaetia bacterium]|nr:outer membrane lipoprotein-sorting protein [Spirochaetia bacterium]
MKRLSAVVLSFLLLCCCTVFAAAESPEQVLKNIDAVVGAPKDQNVKLKIMLVDRAGKVNIREMQQYQKGTEMRLAKFLSPADQKGIGFLSLPNDVMYLYQPAFKKVRAIASHVKNTKFAGTDFTYEDLQSFNMSEKWKVKNMTEKDGMYVLELELKEGKTSDYSKIVITARTDDNFPVKTELFDRTGKACKTLVRENVEKIGGYLIAKSMTMEDLKTGHKTTMEIVEQKYDTGLSDDMFTERFLAK